MRALLLGLLLLSATASAADVGLGVGYDAGVGMRSFFSDQNGRVDYVPSVLYPTVDLAIDRTTIQIHPVDTLMAAASDSGGRFLFGANVWYRVIDHPIAGPLSATLEPGLSVDVETGPSGSIDTLLATRAGLRVASPEGVVGWAGLYLTPQMGVTAPNSGKVQFAANVGVELTVGVYLGRHRPALPTEAGPAPSADQGPD